MGDISSIDCVPRLKSITCLGSTDQSFGKTDLRGNKWPLFHVIIAPSLRAVAGEIHGRNLEAVYAANRRFRWQSGWVELFTSCQKF
ncbi:MAG: hypothetical protein DMG92_14475 [Acidobacteria bacterium]|nr:MAG: hypothetical protein DMG92_14475 [Acidobacteriota bacterium]